MAGQEGDSGIGLRGRVVAEVEPGADEDVAEDDDVDNEAEYDGDDAVAASDA